MEDISEIIKSLSSKLVQLDHFHKQKDQLQLTQIAREIKDQIDNISNFDQLQKLDKAKLNYFKGKAIAISENYEKSAEELLTKSIRLDPRNSEAWSTLGEVFYAKKDYVQARRSFEGSLEISGPQKDTLRKLSIVYRFLEEPEEKKECVLKSIDLAKQALSLDFNDGESWYILGNAHLTNFFTNSKSYEDIQKSLKSYSQSQKFSQAENPDLRFNKALALNAAELYAEALSELDVAHQLDQGLTANLKKDEILANLQNISEMIQKKVNMKKKTITNLCKSIPCQLKTPGSFNLVSVSELNPGQNSKKMLSFKILGNSNLEFPPIFVCCDFKGEFFSLSIYSFPKQTRISPGSTVFVNEPFFNVISAGNIEYPSVQVRDPNNLMVQSN